MAGVIVNQDTRLVNILKYSFRRDPRYVFATDSAYLVKQAINEREELEDQGWLVFAHSDPDRRTYQLYICVDSKTARALVKIQINKKIKKNLETFAAIKAIYDRQTESLESLKDSL